MNLTTREATTSLNVNRKLTLLLRHETGSAYYILRSESHFFVCGLTDCQHCQLGELFKITLPVKLRWQKEIILQEMYVPSLYIQCVITSSHDALQSKNTLCVYIF